MSGSMDELLKELRSKASTLDTSSSPTDFKPTCVQDDIKASFMSSFKNRNGFQMPKNTLPPAPPQPSQ